MSEGTEEATVSEPLVALMCEKCAFPLERLQADIFVLRQQLANAKAEVERLRAGRYSYTGRVFDVSEFDIMDIPLMPAGMVAPGIFRLKSSEWVTLVPHPDRPDLYAEVEEATRHKPCSCALAKAREVCGE